MRKEIFRRMRISFAISALCGLIVNLIADCILNSVVEAPAIGMSPAFVELFRTPVMAAYVNILLYGLIGATFAGMTFLFEYDKIGFIVQILLYYVATGIVLAGILIFLWQLQKYPAALISTLCGYLVTYIIVTILMYRDEKRNIREINDMLMRQE